MTKNTAVRTAVRDMSNLDEGLLSHGDLQQAAPRRVRVIFHSQDGAGGNDDLFVAVNGRAFLIKREYEVCLPPEVMQVVENARQTVFEQGSDGRVAVRHVNRYAYTVLGQDEGDTGHEG